MKFRASYTVLSQWEKGNYDQAVEIYFKLSQFTTREMAEGSDLHDAWQRHIAETKCLPEVFGGKKLKNPLPEIKIEVQIAPWLELVGVVDCLDEDIIEFKSGTGRVSQYLRSKQPYVYQLLTDIAAKHPDRAKSWLKSVDDNTWNPIEVTHTPHKRARLYVHNQYVKESKSGFAHLTEKTHEDALEWVTTLAADMHCYLEDNRLYERLG